MNDNKNEKSDPCTITSTILKLHNGASNIAGGWYYQTIASGIVSSLIEYLMTNDSGNNNNDQLEFESLKILTNISSGRPNHTLFLIKHDGLIEHIVNILLKSKIKNICSQGNIIWGSILLVIQ